MYCPNCGKQVDEKAVVCIHCGCALNFNQLLSKKSRGKGIASMVLGILGVVYSLAGFSILTDLSFLNYEDYASRIGYAIGTVLFQSVFAIIAICLAISERKEEKNGFNTAGFWLSIVTFILVVIQFFAIMDY